MTFKKDGADPTMDRKPYLGGLNFVGAMFALLGIGQQPLRRKHRRAA